MIDKQAFAAGMGVLAGNFNRTVDAAVTRAYYVVLSPQLSTQQFQDAVTRCMTEETFWPSAAQLLQKAKPDDCATALGSLDHVNHVLAQHGGFRWLPHATYQAEFDAPTKAAISYVGGLAEICECPAERWGKLARKFIEGYRKFLNPERQIAAPQTDGKVRQLVASVADTLSGRDRAAGER